MDYIYSVRSEGGVGYAECSPAGAPAFEAALEILERRPLDAFLRKHLLGRLLGLDQAALSGLAASCLARQAPGLAGLLIEAHELGVESMDARMERLPASDVEALRACAQPIPLPRRGERMDAGPFRANISSHQPLPQSALDAARAAAPPSARRVIKQRRGALATAWRAWRGRDLPPEDAPDPRLIHSAALERLQALGICASGEMRHEASLSPIALVREWHLKAGADFGPCPHRLIGVARAWGRGLSLAQARVSCVMEMLERVCAYAHVEQGGACGLANGRPLIHGSANQMRGRLCAILPELPGVLDWPLYWLEGVDALGSPVLAPAQAVYLLLNMGEPALFESLGSTGLAAGAVLEQARLAALLELIERDAHATMPFRPDQCFELASRDARIQALLDDYRACGIFPQFQDITTEIGVPSFRCFVRGLDGRVAQATAAALSGAKAALAALTEVPWPYSLAPVFAPRPTARGIPGLPRRFLEDLPDYSMPGAAPSLAMLEQALIAMGLVPHYFDLTKPKLDFPVVRAFIPGLEMDAELDGGPSARLLARLASEVE